MPHNKLLETTSTIPVRTEGTLRLAIVSDTHSAPHPELCKHLRVLAPDAILHAGDVGDLTVLDELSGIAPVHAVRGNIDIHTPELPDLRTVHIVSSSAVPLRILLTHIGMAGPRLRTEVYRRARTEGATMVVCGHSHVPFMGKDHDVFIFNPGSAGPRRFRLPIVFGLIEMSPEGVRLSHRDCETGQPWEPPPARAAAR